MNVSTSEKLMNLIHHIGKAKQKCSMILVDDKNLEKIQHSVIIITIKRENVFFK